MCVLKFQLRAIPPQTGGNMSGVNGDKSRFHVDRKQKIARRKRNRELLAKLPRQPKGASQASATKPKVVAS
jgi:hypothetical protein